MAALPVLRLISERTDEGPTSAGKRAAYDD